MEDPVPGTHFYFWPYIQNPAAPCLSQPSWADTATAFLHLAMVYSLLLPLTNSNFQSCLKQEPALPSSTGPGWTHVYQMTNDWWVKEVLFSQPTSFPSCPLSNFSIRILDAGSLSQAGEFASAPILVKTVTSSGLHAPLSEAIQTDFLAHCKLADFLSI